VSAGRHTISANCFVRMGIKLSCSNERNKIKNNENYSVEKNIEN
jgi:hypothetical protein